MPCLHCAPNAAHLSHFLRRKQEGGHFCKSTRRKWHGIYCASLGPYIRRSICQEVPMALNRIELCSYWFSAQQLRSLFPVRCSVGCNFGNLNAIKSGIEPKSCKWCAKDGNVASIVRIYAICGSCSNNRSYKTHVPHSHHFAFQSHHTNNHKQDWHGIFN